MSIANEIRAAFESVFKMMNEEREAIYAKANDAKRIINEQYAVLGSAADELFELSDVCEEMASTFMGMGDMDYALGETITGFVDNAPALPEKDVTEFVGFCEVCGEELSAGDYYVREGDDVLCGDCASEEDEVEPDEEGEPEQLHFAFDERVSERDGLLDERDGPRYGGGTIHPADEE